MPTHVTTNAESTAALNSSRDVNAITNARARLLRSARVFERIAASTARERANIDRLRREMGAKPLPNLDDPLAVMARLNREAAAGLEAQMVETT